MTDAQRAEHLAQDMRKALADGGSKRGFYDLLRTAADAVGDGTVNHYHVPRVDVDGVKTRKDLQKVNDMGEAIYSKLYPEGPGVEATITTRGNVVVSDLVMNGKLPNGETVMVRQVSELTVENGRVVEYRITPQPLEGSDSTGIETLMKAIQDAGIEMPADAGPSAS